jgi:DNA invertase Pin-like site-specific DNA recombinase
VSLSSEDLKVRPQFKLLLKDINLVGEGIVTSKIANLAFSYPNLLEFLTTLTQDYKKHIFCIKDHVDSITINYSIILKILNSFKEIPKIKNRQSSEIGYLLKRERGEKVGSLKKNIISKQFVIQELKKGSSPEKIAERISPQVKVSIIRNRMKEWGIWESYRQGKFINIK